MTGVADTPSPTLAPLPADDPARSLGVARQDGPDLKRVFIGGGLYTILLSGEQTGGDPAEGPTSTPPTLTPEERVERMERGKKAQSLALRYRSEFLKP